MQNEPITQRAIATETVATPGQAVLSADSARAEETLHKSEEALRKSEARLAGIIASAMDGIVTIDAEERITAINKSAETIFGCTADAVIGEKIARFIPDRFRSQHSNHIRQFGAANVTRRAMGAPTAVRGVRSNGEEFPVDASISHVKVGGEQLFTVILRDVTERVRAEEALRAYAEELQMSEARFASAFEYAAIGMALVSAEGRWLKVNRALCELVGYSRDELLAKTFQEITHPDDLEADLDHLRQLLAGESVAYQMEKRYFHKLGRTIWVLLSVSLVRDAHGQPVHFISQIQDITERKLAAARLEQQAALLDETRDAITVRDIGGRILFWNKGAERTYGWPREEAMGRTVTTFLCKDIHRYHEAHQGALQNGEWSGEMIHATKDGGNVIVESRWTLVRDSHGNPKSILTINTDVTEKRQIERQFLRTQRMESIGTLASGVAHDLNNILSPILLSIEVLRRLSTDPEAASTLDLLEANARRGADIVRQVLSFARGVEGTRTLLAAARLLKDLAQIVGDTFPKNIHLKIPAPQEAFFILGDPTQVHQILLNLCLNARDAMPSGGELAVSVESCCLDEHDCGICSEAKPGAYVVFHVADTGAGIPSSIVDRIYEPFFTTKEVGQGTGLGLSTVLAIVKSHDGFVMVESEVGKGTAFHVYLPAAPTATPPASQHTRPALPHGRGELVLVVDDEAAILKVTERTLLTFGYRILTASDGAEAVAVFAANKAEIAAVITDIAMPVMDGIAASRALRRLSPAVKIIATSGLLDESNQAKLTEAGVKHFVPKPFAARTLLETLQAALAES